MTTNTTRATVGSTIATLDPRTGKKASGTVKWISPTGETYMVVLADGYLTYEFPREG